MAASPPPKMMLSSLLLALVLLILPRTDALQITPGSSCTSFCGDTSATNSSDIVCSDFDYYSSGAGSTFMSCIECLETSNATSGPDSDVSWLLYNLRYASSVCIYDFPNHNTSNSSTSSKASCDLEYACAPLQEALEYGSLNPSNGTDYGYCQADSGAFYGTSIDDCVSCLQSSPSTYTANFLLALQAGCQQQPQAGTTLSITGSLFSTTAINITDASKSTSTATSTSSAKSSLSINDIIAIVCSLGVLFLLAIGLFVLYCCRQRRYAREDAQLLGNDGYPSHQQHFFYGKDRQGSVSTAQTYVMPHYTVDHKSQPAPAYSMGSNPAVSEQQAAFPLQESFASNADYYDRLEARSRSQPLQAHPVRLNNLSPSIASSSSEVDTIGHLPIDALPTHPAYIPRSMTPGQLGGRASRNVSRSASVRSSAPSQSQDQAQQGRAPSRARCPRKTDSYAIQVYLNGPEEPGASAARAAAARGASGRNIQVELADPPETYTSPGRQLLYDPPVLSGHHGHSTSLPSGQSGLAPPPPDRAQTASPAVSSLILPSVPRIRVPSTKPARLRIDDTTSAKGGSRSMRVSGPLAFPDPRFSVRPPNDRIVEQTLASGPQLDLPIASGKSYLYG